MLWPTPEAITTSFHCRQRSTRSTMCRFRHVWPTASGSPFLPCSSRLWLHFIRRGRLHGSCLPRPYAMNNRIFKSPYPLLDRRCYCCDSHHMKPLVADIWFLSTVKTHRGTGGTVGKHPSTAGGQTVGTKPWRYASKG